VLLRELQSTSTPVHDNSSADTTPNVLRDSSSALNSSVGSTESTPRRNTPSVEDDVFLSKAGFVRYLEGHRGSGPAMAEVSKGTYSKENRRCITGIAASKLVDIYGSLPSTSVKVKTAVWLSEIMGLQAAAFFDPKTHKGYLNKALENRRRKNPDEKRWSWSKRTRVINNNQEQSTSSATNLASNSESVDEIDGCPRNVQDCEYCGGKLYCAVGGLIMSVEFKMTVNISLIYCEVSHSASKFPHLEMMDS